MKSKIILFAIISVAILIFTIGTYLYTNIMKPINDLPDLENPVIWNGLIINFDNMMLYVIGDDSITFSHLNHRECSLHIKKVNKSIDKDDLLRSSEKKSYQLISSEEHNLFNKKAIILRYYVSSSKTNIILYYIKDMNLFIIYEGTSVMPHDFVKLIEGIEVVQPTQPH